MRAARVDAHHHLWEYSRENYSWMAENMGVLRRNFMADDLSRVLQDASIDAAVTVQARQTTEESQWLLDLADRHQFIKGVVGWVPLVEKNVGDYLKKFSANSKFVAVRHVLQDEPDEFYMLREDFNRGVSLLKDYNIAYDILIFERHLPQTITFVDRHPEQRFILDHIAKPRIKKGLLSPWRGYVSELAKRDNVYCKLSGMVTEADWETWKERDLQPYFDLVLEAFRPERLMFGSDWPVLLVASEYKRWVETVERLISRLSIDEQARIFGGTANQAYRL